LTAREIAERDGLEEGLSCVLSTLELGFSFDVEGNHPRWTPKTGH